MNKTVQQYLLICDHAFLDKNNKLNVIGLFDNVNLNTLPGNILKIVIIGCYEMGLDLESTVSLEVNILRPDNSQLIHLDNKSAAINSSDNTLRFVFEMGNLKFDKEGIHSIEVLVNGEKIGLRTFTVKKQSN